MWHKRVTGFFGNSMAVSHLVPWEILPDIFISQYAPITAVMFWQCLLKNATNSNALAVICRNSPPPFFFFLNLLTKSVYEVEIFYKLSAAACGVHLH